MKFKEMQKIQRQLMDEVVIRRQQYIDDMYAEHEENHKQYAARGFGQFGFKYGLRDIPNYRYKCILGHAVRCLYPNLKYNCGRCGNPLVEE